MIHSTVNTGIQKEIGLRKGFNLHAQRKVLLKKFVSVIFRLFSKSNELSNTIRKHEDTIKSKNYELFLVETYIHSHTVPKHILIKSSFIMFIAEHAENKSFD